MNQREIKWRIRQLIFLAKKYWLITLLIFNLFFIRLAVEHYIKVRRENELPIWDICQRESGLLQPANSLYETAQNMKDCKSNGPNNLITEKKSFGDLLNFACTRLGQPIIIVMPFHDGGEKVFSKIRTNLIRWEEKGYFPCGSDSPPIDFAFYYNKKKSLVVEGRLKEILEEIPNARKCFREIHFLYAEIEEDKNRDKSIEITQQWVKLFDILWPHYSYFFWMEYDVYPIRSRWLEKIYVEALCGDDFWIKGSYHRGASRESVASNGWHINGNALYNCGSCKMRKFIEPIAHQPWAWDVVLFFKLFLAENAEITRDVLYQYLYTDFIQNIPSDDWNEKNVLNTSPNTYLVHGR